MIDEQLLLNQDGVYCWPGKKMKSTVFSAKLGRLLLTDRRLVFLSSGKNDGLSRVLAGVKGGVILPETASQLGSEALLNPGSLDVAIGSITRCEPVKRALSISYVDGTGAAADYAFSQQVAMPGREQWVAQIEALRSQPATSDTASPAAAAQPGAWHADPVGRHEQRWWDGERWTEHVSDAGATSVDPV